MTKRVRDMTDDEVRDLCGSRDVPESAVRDAAFRVAETVRLLNYLTLPQDGAPGLTYPADVYDIAAGLRSTAEMLPQLHRQMSGWLASQEERGLLADAGDPDVADASLNARAWLGDAEVFAGHYAEALARVHNSLASVKAAGA